ncbi:MAG: type IV pili methyl-accepting chemotaxis transducer N-terminal domain-containing protein [Rhodocyclaceae bacterium]|nr:type IV pili methyl-accepting chemotaxis transducer N-terminal domain-containing protein [Rhodocyclaceae bacterium]
MAEHSHSGELPAAPRKRRWSIVLHLGLSLAAMAALALVFIFASAYILRQSSGQAAAINVAGSLRMQTYAIGVELAQPRDPAARRAAVRNALAGFSARYDSPALQAVLPNDLDSPLYASYAEAGNYWLESFRPLALALLEADPPQAALQIAPHIEQQVERIDRLVKLIELDLEARLNALRILQAVSLLLLCVVTALMALNIYRQVLAPIAELLRCAAAVRRGDFSVQVAARGGSDLAELGEAFNIMVRDLSNSYADLEARVRDKTALLERSNQSLGLLYDITRTLAEASSTAEALRAVLRQTERVTGVERGRVVDCEAAEAPPLAAQATAATAAEPPSQAATTLQYALGGDADSRTYLEFDLPAGRELDDTGHKLLQAVGRHVGAALAARAGAEERHRLALLDERAVIARELHDSLAQALAYQKIQVSRINALLARGQPGSEVQDAMDELKTGLNDASRQLRELLATFRLRMDGRGLAAALAATVEEFRRRGGFAIRLENRLGQRQLGSGQEIHVLHVVREALSNIERHAAAKRVSVRLEWRAGARVGVLIEDDGLGIGVAQARPQHYGMAIMRDRAHSLGGELKISTGASGGTCIEMEFPAQHGTQ